VPGEDDGTWIPNEGAAGTWSPTVEGGEGPEPPSPPSPPEPARERYALGVEVARGGLGRIVEAWDHQLDREVAVKQLLKPSPGAEARFDREMHLTARLQHPNIVPVFDGGRLEGAPYLAMRRVHGRSLGEVLEAAQGLNERMRLLPHLIDVANALAYAHGQRVVHRDLKPDNVLVGDFGETVVIDWGLAKDLDVEITEEVPALSLTQPLVTQTPLMRGRRSSSRSLTRVGSVMGTPSYMAPEQAVGHAVDARADVYALGAMLYELLAGQAPYADAPDALAAVRGGPPVDVSSVEPTAPRDLVAVVRRAMERSADDRYDDASAFAAELSRFLEGRFVSAYDYTLRERATRLVRRYPVAVGLLVVLLVGAVAFVVALDESRAVAEEALAVAEQEREVAERLHDEGVRREDELRIDQARRVAESDPVRAIELLAGLSGQTPFDGRVRTIFAAAMATRPGFTVPDVPASVVYPMARVDDGLLVAVGDGLRLYREERGAPVELPVDGTVLSVLELDGCAVVATNTQVARVVDGRLRTVWRGRPRGGWPHTGERVAFGTDEGVVVVGCAGPPETFETPFQGRYLLAGEEGLVTVSNKEVTAIRGGASTTHAGCDGRVWGLMEERGRLVTIGDHDSLCFIDLASGERRRVPVPGATWLEHIVATPDGGYLVAGDAHRVWRLDADGEVLAHVDTEGLVLSLASTADGAWIGGTDWLVRWRAGRVQRVPMQGPVRAIVDIDGNRMAAAVGETVRLVDSRPRYREILPPSPALKVGFVDTDEGPRVMHTPVDSGTWIVKDCFGHQVTASREGTVTLDGEVWFEGTPDVVVTCMERSRQVVVVQPGRQLGVYALDGPPTLVASEPIEGGRWRLVSVEGHAYAVGGGELLAWDGQGFQRRGGFPEFTTHLSIAGPDRLAAIGDSEVVWLRDGGLRIIDDVDAPSALLAKPGLLAIGSLSGVVTLVTDEGRTELVAHGRWVELLEASADGRFLLTGGWDDRAVLWDLSVTPPEGRVLEGHGDGVAGGGFVPGGVVTISYDGQVLSWTDGWPLEPEALRRLVLATRDALAQGQAPPPSPPAPVVPVEAVER